jgi:hypothetical protein
MKEHILSESSDMKCPKQANPERQEVSAGYEGVGGNGS